MRNINDAHAPVAEHVDNSEQMLDLVLRKRGGRLVKYDDLRTIGDRLRDLDHLTLRNGHRAHDPVRIDIDAQLVEYFHGLPVHFGLVDHQSEMLRVTPQPDIIHNRALQSLIQLLMDHGHAIVQRLSAVFEVDFFAFQEDGSTVLVINAEQALHQRGFACAVFSHQSMDGSPFQRQRNMIERLDAREGLRDIRHLQQDILIHIHFMSSLLPWPV